MLYAALTAELQSQYAQIQAQIESLQEQQRLIQAELQRVGSAESKMESALSLLAEAIAETRGVCPGQLAASQEAANSLFLSQPIAQIQAGEDVVVESEPQENPVPPESDEPAIDVVTEVVSEEEETEEPATEVSHQAPARSLHKQPTKPLQWLATKRGIDFSQMKRHEIAKVLVGQVTQAELQEAVEHTTQVG